MTFETTTRNTLDLISVAYVREHSRLPVIVDPSHGTGVRELVRPMALSGVMAGASGLIIETHIEPDEAVSDSEQTVDVATLKEIITRVNDIWRFV